MKIKTTIIAAMAALTINTQAETPDALAKFDRDVAAWNQKHPEDNVEPEPETMAQKNAVKMAEEYLDSGGFSRRGLIEQLIYEGFSRKDAVYGADNAGYGE